VGVIVNGFSPDGKPDARAIAEIERALRGYAVLIEPWSQSVARWMVASASRRNARAWEALSDDMGKALRVELEQAPTGALFQALVSEQVGLITSIPIDAAQRVQKIAAEFLVTGQRADVLSKEIMRSGEVSKSRADLIARTEVSRSAASFTQARATFAGSEGYIWRTSRDGTVRPTHKAQEGKYIKWTSPPKTDPGLAPYHAGCGPNCRCYAEPVF